MGMERGTAAAAAQNGYQRNNYHRSNYRSENYGGNYSANGTDRKYGSYEGKYDTVSKFDRTTEQAAAGTTTGAAATVAQNGGYAANGSARTGTAQHTTASANSATVGNGNGASAVKAVVQEEAPATSVAALEKKLNTVQAEMQQALQETTSKENEKFDLIFSILIELQTRQGKLEESVKQLKAQFGGEPMGNGQMMQPMNGQQMLMQNGQGNGQQGGQMIMMNGNQMASQVGNMGQQVFVGSQMGMNQQFGQTMMAQDGSGAYFAPVMVAAVPQNGGQMQFVNQMMPQGMPQQMSMQFVGQGQEQNDFQYMQGMNMQTMSPDNTGNAINESGAPGTSRSSGSGQETAPAQDAQPCEPKMEKNGMALHEEE